MLLREPVCVEQALSNSHTPIWADAAPVPAHCCQGSCSAGHVRFRALCQCERKEMNDETPLSCSGKSALERTPNLQGALFLLLQEMDVFLSVLCVIVTKYHKDILFRVHFIIPNVM